MFSEKKIEVSVYTLNIRKGVHSINTHYSIFHSILKYLTYLPGYELQHTKHQVSKGSPIYML